MSHRSLFIIGILNFSSRRVILKSSENEFFVRPFSLRDGYVHGDSVKVKIVKRGDGEKLPEVEVVSLVHRSRDVLLATITEQRGKRYLEVRREQGSFRSLLSQNAHHYQVGDIVACKFLRDGVCKPLHRFAHEGEHDLDERLILFLSSIRHEFPYEVMKESEALESPKIDESHEDLLEFFEALRLHEALSTTKFEPKKPLITMRDSRIDFRNWYTLTIDGADAKDLDDAISLAPYPNGDILLGVHIADVAEYVQEGTNLDREAYIRATSIYTPGKVIPMLPEKLSNDLCSLHPGGPKYTLSCMILLDAEGRVRHTEIVEGIIESRKK